MKDSEFDARLIKLLREFFQNFEAKTSLPRDVTTLENFLEWLEKHGQ